MAKPDLTRDYYADLELTSTATELEIKKQFRQLALKYHPDRNPGREAEVNAKFQTIQAASEILLDSEQKLKYDSGRARAGRGGGSAFASQSRPASGFTKGNPWANAASNFPPPPSRTQRRSNPTGPPPSAGASRYSTFTGGFTPHHDTRNDQDDAEARRKTYEAWSRMRGDKTKPGTSSTQGQESKSRPVPPRPAPPPVPKRNGYAPNSAPGDEPPAPSSYYTARPRAPTAPKPEPQPAQKSKPTQQNTQSSQQPPKPNVDPLRMFREKVGVPVEPRVSTPYAGRGGERTNPFQSANVPPEDTRTASGASKSFGGDGSRERRRSASPNRNLKSEFAAAGRTGSDPNIAASPKRTFSRATRAQAHRATPVIDLTSSEDDSSPEPSARKFAQPKSRKTQNITTPLKSGTFGAETDTPAPKADPKMYEDSTKPATRLQYLRSCRSSAKPPTPLPLRMPDPSGRSASVRTSSEGYTPPSGFSEYTDFRSPPALSGPYSPSMNAFESIQFETLDKLVKKRGYSVEALRQQKASANVPLSTPAAHKYIYGVASAAEMHEKKKPSVVRPRSAERCMTHNEKFSIWKLAKTEPTMRPSGEPWPGFREFQEFLEHNVNNNANPEPFSFTFNVDGATYTANSNRIPEAFTSSSAENVAENVNTTFTPEDWHGKFQAGEDYFGSTNQPNLSRARSDGNTPAFGSPSKRRPFVNTETDTSAIDPETLSQSQSAGAAETSPPPTGPKFSADEWKKTFAEPIFTNPPQPTPARAFSRPGTSRRNKTGSSSSKGPKPKATVVDSDDDEPVIIGSRPASSHSKSKFSTEGDFVGSPNAMDIDPKPAPTRSASTVRNVPLEPSRPEWRSGEPNFDTVPSTQKSGQQQGQDGDLKATFNDFKNTAPFSVLSTGLNDFADLKTTLPFESKASSTVPFAKGFGTNKLELPQPPKGPSPPAIAPNAPRPSSDAWKAYSNQMIAYMNAWKQFNTRMLNHFAARRDEVDSMGSNWMFAIGDKDLLKYIEGQKEDEKIREWWDVASHKHMKTMEDFAWAKKVFRDGQQDAGARSNPLFGEVA